MSLARFPRRMARFNRRRHCMHSAVSGYTAHGTPGPHLRVTLFGEPSVSYLRDLPEDVPMPGRCVLLLAYLVLYPKTRMRERIASTLWPDSLDCEARASLRRTLHALVHALPKEAESWILMDAKRLAWNSRAPLWCDVDVFDRLSLNEATLATAVDVYGGDLLANAMSKRWPRSPRAVASAATRPVRPSTIGVYSHSTPSAKTRCARCSAYSTPTATGPVPHANTAISSTGCATSWGSSPCPRPLPITTKSLAD